MRLFNVMISPELDRRLKDHSKETGVPMSETVRRAVDEYLDKRAKTDGEDQSPARAKGRKDRIPGRVSEAV